MDHGDLLTNALEPGERIVWCDRPHGLGPLVRFAYGKNPVTALATMWVSVAELLLFGGCFVAAMWNAWQNARTSASVQGSLMAASVAFVTVSLIVIMNVLSLLRARGMLYAISDRARGFVIRGQDLHWFQLPSPSEIVLSKGAISFSDTKLFYGVSDPHATLETIREVAARKA